MRIRRLQIKDFRRYRDLDVDFAPGLTVVRGPYTAYLLDSTDLSSLHALQLNNCGEFDMALLDAEPRADLA